MSFKIGDRVKVKTQREGFFHHGRVIDIKKIEKRYNVWCGYGERTLYMWVDENDILNDERESCDMAACPRCGGKTEIKISQSFFGEEYKVNKCKRCGWC